MSKTRYGLTALTVFGLATILGIGIITSGQILTTDAASRLSDEAESALENNDYEAFVAAVESNSNERTHKRLSHLDEEKFTEIRERYLQKEVVEEAFENGDYTAFVANAPSYLLEKIDSEEAFNEAVENRAELLVLQEQVEAAVAADDYDAFVEAVMAIQDFRDENRPDNAPSFQPRELDEEKLQAMFEKAKEYYSEHGELPGKDGFGFRKEGRGLREGFRN